MTVPGPFAPSNLILPHELRNAHVDGDLYDICERVKEISPALHIAPLNGDDGYAFAVVEKCLDGVDRVVVKVRELDARVLDHLRGMMAKPLAQRLEEIEKTERRLEADRKEAELDDLYERVGRPMWTDLERTGFITRPVSYPKKGIKPTRE